MGPGGGFFSALDAVLESAGPFDTADVPTTAGATRVTSWGSASLPPLLLLPGYGATSGSWAGVAGRLAPFHRVHAVDLVGDVGRSVAEHPMRQPEDLHDWLDDVVSWSAADRGAGLVGHSYGAWLASSYVLARPGRVKTLTLVDPTDCFNRLSARYVLRALPVVLGPSPTRWHSFLNWETRGCSVDDDWAHLAGLATLLPARHVVRPRRPSPAEWRTSTTRTLVLLAEHSRAHNIKKIADVAGRYPQMTVEILFGASHHSVPAAQTDQISDAILRAGSHDL